MESYIITLVNLQTHIESSVSVDVDEAETSDDIVINAAIDGQAIMNRQKV